MNPLARGHVLHAGSSFPECGLLVSSSGCDYKAIPRAVLAVASVGAKGLLSAVTSIREGPKAELAMLHPSKTRSLLLGANQQLEFPLPLLLSQGDSRFLYLISSLSKITICNNHPRHTQVKYITLPMTIVMSRYFFLFPQ